MNTKKENIRQEQYTYIEYLNKFLNRTKNLQETYEIPPYDLGSQLATNVMKEFKESIKKIDVNNLVK